MAERDFDEGELIFHENALGVGPNPESTLQCILCSKKACITQCLKITEKVSFNITSEASYIYILSDQKFIKKAKKGQFWRVFENLKLIVKQCYQTGQF